MEKYIIENGIKYELKGEQYYPIFSETNTVEHHIGKYGLLHRDYLKQHKRGTYTTFLTEFRLNAYLYEIDVQANGMVEAILVANLARERGIGEELKASDVLKWVAEMNNIKASAEKLFCWRCCWYEVDPQLRMAQSRSTNSRPSAVKRY